MKAAAVYSLLASLIFLISGCTEKPCIEPAKAYEAVKPVAKEHMYAPESGIFPSYDSEHVSIKEYQKCVSTVSASIKAKNNANQLLLMIFRAKVEKEPESGRLIVKNFKWSYTFNYETGYESNEW